MHFQSPQTLFSDVVHFCRNIFHACMDSAKAKKPWLPGDLPDDKIVNVPGTLRADGNRQNHIPVGTGSLPLPQ